MKTARTKILTIDLYYDKDGLLYDGHADRRLPAELQDELLQHREKFADAANIDLEIEVGVDGSSSPGEWGRTVEESEAPWSTERRFADGAALRVDCCCVSELSSGLLLVVGEFYSSLIEQV